MNSLNRDRENKRKQLKKIWLALDSENRIYDIRLTKEELEEETETWSWIPEIICVNVEINLKPELKDLYTL